MVRWGGGRERCHRSAEENAGVEEKIKLVSEGVFFFFELGRRERKETSRRRLWLGPERGGGGSEGVCPESVLRGVGEFGPLGAKCGSEIPVV